MERFLLSLPRPTAVFAAMGGRARQVANLCAEIGLRVPIAEISAQVGYTRPSRLAAMFRKETGETMRAWRGTHRADN